MKSEDVISMPARCNACRTERLDGKPCNVKTCLCSCHRNVDRSQRTISGREGTPVTDDHREIDPASGQQKGYVVLTEAERAKGFVRPVRRTYIHVGKPPEGKGFEYPIVKVFPGGCGTRTTCSQDIAETYARDPEFYSGTFCCSCRAHFPLDQFVWEGTTEAVGS